MKKFVLFFKTYQGYEVRNINGISKYPYDATLYNSQNEAYKGIAKVQDVSFDLTPGSVFLRIVENMEIQEMDLSTWPTEIVELRFQLDQLNEIIQDLAHKANLLRVKLNSPKDSSCVK